MPFKIDDLVINPDGRVLPMTISYPGFDEFTVCGQLDFKTGNMNMFIKFEEQGVRLALVGMVDPDNNVFEGELECDYRDITDVAAFEAKNGFKISGDPENLIPDTFRLEAPFNHLDKWETNNNKKDLANFMNIISNDPELKKKVTKDLKNDLKTIPEDTANLLNMAGQNIEALKDMSLVINTVIGNLLHDMNDDCEGCLYTKE